MKRVQSNASPPPKVAKRRTHDTAFKRRLVELTLAPRASVARIALDHGLNANMAARAFTRLGAVGGNASGSNAHGSSGDGR